MSPEAWHTLLALCVVAAGASFATAPRSHKPLGPTEGQSGKDSVWVPTPPELIERMLDMACVTAQDYVVDLGSGDGRMVIAAAKRGAHARGVEYDPQLIDVAEHAAALEGVSHLATFEQGDLYEADISQATVLVLFLLPENLRRLIPKFAELKAGARIVTNRFEVDGWPCAAVSRVGGHSDSYCTARLYITPANAGTVSVVQPH